MRSALSVSRVMVLSLTATRKRRTGGSCFSSSTTTVLSFLSSLRVVSRRPASSWAVKSSVSLSAQAKDWMPRKNRSAARPRRRTDRSARFAASVRHRRPCGSAASARLRAGRLSLGLGAGRSLRKAELFAIGRPARRGAANLAAGKLDGARFLQAGPHDLADVLVLVAVERALDPDGPKTVGGDLKIAGRFAGDDVIDSPCPRFGWGT